VAAAMAKRDSKQYTWVSQVVRKELAGSECAK
jgi:hypothetical protein